MKKISILIPVYNESASLYKLYGALMPLINNELTPRQYEWEVMLVDDGSRDDSLDIMRELNAKDPRIHYVALSRNFGKETAMLAGMDAVSGDATVIMDADLQHPVDAIPSMIDKWIEGYDDVYGLRTTRGRESWLRKRLSLAYYGLLRRSTRIEVLPNVGDFRLLDRRVVDAICQLRENQRYTKGLYCWVGYKKTAVPFEQHGRDAGKSSFSFLSLLNLGIEGIVSFTTAPLRFATVAGFITALVAMAYIIFIIIKTLVWGEAIQGFPTLICVILFLGGLQLIAIGIIGEYIGRIFTETKQRPPYLLSERDGQRVE